MTNYCRSGCVQARVLFDDFLEVAVESFLLIGWNLVHPDRQALKRWLLRGLPEEDGGSAEMDGGQQNDDDSRQYGQKKHRVCGHLVSCSKTLGREDGDWSWASNGPDQRHARWLMGIIRLHHAMLSRPRDVYWPAWPVRMIRQFYLKGDQVFAYDELNHLSVAFCAN